MFNNRRIELLNDRVTMQAELIRLLIKNQKEIANTQTDIAVLLDKSVDRIKSLETKLCRQGFQIKDLEEK